MSSNTLRQFLAVITLSIVSLSWGSAVAQGIGGCNSLDDAPDGPKVVVGCIAHEQADGELESLTGKYKTRLLIELTAMLRDLCPSANPKPVFCEDRAPNIDGTDFNSDFVKSLNNIDVLLEIWGQITETPAGDEIEYGAELCMMLIPVRHYSSGSDEVDHHVLIYTSEGQSTAQGALLDIVYRPEFQIYTLVAYGMKALKNEQYDTAKSYLASASILWQAAVAGNTLASTATEPEMVTAYIASLEQQCVAAAESSSSYDGDAPAISALLEGESE
jgi:hypothetical protein